jgi:vancomycin resistance protein VanJ
VLKSAQQILTPTAWTFVAGASSLLVFIVGAFVLRPVSLSAITVFPVWCWVALGTLLCGAAWVARPAKLGIFKPVLLAVTLGWVAALLLLAEEPTSLLRGAWTGMPSPDDERPDGQLRIVSLNCGGGSADAAREVIRWKPDIVLLQEIPDANVLSEIAESLFGEAAVIAAELDTAIIARVPMLSQPQQNRNRRTFSACTISLPGIGDARFASIHLTVPPIDISLWRPATWRSHSSARRLQREQLMSAMEGWLTGDPSVPRILAGDFNAPQGDWLFQPLRPLLRDAFDEAGVGWGNTIENSIPVLRIDQVWLSRHFKAVAVAAFKSSHSDHRLVVADVVIASPAPLP